MENDNLENSQSNVTFNRQKDFYKGMSGELRYKAEGLFKKAKEKGISIDDIKVEVVKEDYEDFPGVGKVYLPTYFAQIKGSIKENGQNMADGKLIDYYNKYQKYVSQYIDKKNRNVKDINLNLDDTEKFRIAKQLIDDKEFGLEKTITGACDRLIRKLMGENDWLYPKEAQMLDEEFNEVDRKVHEQKTNEQSSIRKATDKQISYFKTKIKNLGVEPKDEIISGIIKKAGYNKGIDDLSTQEMSYLIDNISNIVAQDKDLT